MMDASSILLSSLNPSSFDEAALRSMLASAKARRNYAELWRAKDWQGLANRSLHHVRAANGAITPITASLHNLRFSLGALSLARREMHRWSDAATRTRGDADLTAKGRAGGKLPDLMNRNRLPYGLGVIIFTAADELLRAQSAALQVYCAAELNLMAKKTRERDDQAMIARKYWESPTSTALSESAARCRTSLHARLGDIYLALMAKRPGYASGLRSLVNWTGFALPGLLRIQFTASYLLKHRPAKADPTAARALLGAALDAATTAREMIAAHLAAIACLFDCGGIVLNRHSRRVLRNASTMRLHGRMQAGKRTSIKRLRRLPDGMFIRLEGELAAAKLVRRKGAVWFEGQLRDVDGEETIRVVAPADLAAEGMAAGQSVRFSCFYRKRGFGRRKEDHVEVRRLDVHPILTNDIWSTAFLDLSARYYRVWPVEMHLTFAAEPTSSARTGAGAAFESDPCGGQRDDLEDAQGELELAQMETAQKASKFYTLSALALFACLTIETGLGIIACMGAIELMREASDEHDLALAKEELLRRKLARAARALRDCERGHATKTIGALSPVGLGGLAVSTGSGEGDGEGDPTGGDWGAGETDFGDGSIPDWLFDWGDNDSGETGGTPSFTDDHDLDSFPEDQDPDDEWPDSEGEAPSFPEEPPIPPSDNYSDIT